MKKMINLLFALLLSLSIISCGGSDSDSDSGSSSSDTVLLPANDKPTDNTPVEPAGASDMRTGTSTETGCSQATLPSCKE